MSALIIEAQKNSPQIVFDPVENRFMVTGRSFPENAKKFYAPVLEWVESFQHSGGETADFTFELYYISSSSIISILELIKRIGQLNESGNDVSITWRFDDDDEDIRKIGEDYSKLTAVPFRLIPN